MNIYNTPWRLVQNQIRCSGGFAMDVFRGKEDPKDIQNGAEAWVGSLTKARGANENCPHFGCAETILPDGREMYLFEAINLSPEEILGAKHIEKYGTQLGMLIKLLDPSEQYLLQAHPTREVAKKYWDSNYGKEEAWFVLSRRADMQEEPYMLLGFKPGITKEKFKDMYHNSTLSEMDKLCHKIKTKVGETYFVPGGMAHALGPGNLVIEIQEPSDLVVFPMKQDALLEYRKKATPNGVFSTEDEELYEQRLLATFNFESEAEEEVLEKCVSKEPIIREGEWGQEMVLVAKEKTEYFAATKAEINGAMPLHQTNDIRIGIVISGEGIIKTDDYQMEIKQGDELFFPYNIGKTIIQGHLNIFFANPAGADY